MDKTLLVLRNEIRMTFSRRSFLVLLLGMPLVAVVVFVVFSLLGGGASSGGSGNAGGLKVEGYVDQARLIKTLPDGIPQDKLLAYPDEAAAKQALAAGEIAAYYIIPPDYVASGSLIYVDPEANPLGSSGQTWVMRSVLYVNLLGGDTELASHVSNPMEVFVTELTPQRGGPEWGEGRFWVPYGTMLLFYFALIMSSSLLRSSTGNERKNRVLEILMSSVSPGQMLTGKVLGLAVAGLLQIAIWMGTSYALLRLGGRTLSLPPGFELPVSILVWGLVFFLLGYLVYATLLAGLGAVAGPNVAGSSTADFVVIWPLIIPLFFISVMVQTPNASLALGLSLFPLTSPIAMMTRLAATDLAIWQPLLAAVLLLLTDVLILRAVSRLFRAQNLLSGQPFTVKQYFRALVTR